MALNKYIVTSNMPECRKYKSVNIANSQAEYEKLFQIIKRILIKNILKF